MIGHWLRRLNFIGSRPVSKSRKKIKTNRLFGPESLEDRTVPAGSLVASADAGAPPEVRVYDSDTGALRAQFLAYDGTILSGVRVAVGDVNGDGFDDLITAVGVNAPPHVKVFSGQNGALIGSFYAYSTGFTGGVFVGSGDLDGDGVDEIITGAGAGAGPHVKAFRVDGTEVASFFAYTPNFLGGVRVAAGDLNGDGRAEIITGVGFGGGPHVAAFNLASGIPIQISSLFAYAPNVSTGIFVAAGDTNGDGVDEIITGAGAGGGPHVQTFNANGTVLSSFFAFDPSYAGGVRVNAADLNNDGVDEILASTGYGVQPIVSVFNGSGVTLTAFVSFPSQIQIGTYVAGSSTPLNLLSTPSEQIQAAYNSLAARVIAHQPVIIIQQNNNFLAPYPYGVFGFGFGLSYPIYYDAPGLFYDPGYFYTDGFFGETVGNPGFADPGYVDPNFVDPGYYYDPYYSDPYFYDPSYYGGGYDYYGGYDDYGGYYY